MAFRGQGHCPRNSLFLESASALLYSAIWNLQPLLQSLTRSKCSRCIYHSYDEKAVEQHRLNGQYNDNTEAKTHGPNCRVSSGTAVARSPASQTSAALKPALPPPPWKWPLPASPTKNEHGHPSTKIGVTKRWPPLWGRLLTTELSPSL